MHVFIAGNILQFSYENYKGTISIRTVQLLGLDFGSNEWYPSDQWFIRCWDLDKKNFRSFALAKINPRSITVTTGNPIAPMEVAR
jgi:predicted DNA-binding transcriptional regulator YafY